MIRTADKKDVRAMLKVLEAAFHFKTGTKKWHRSRALILKEPETWRVLCENARIVGVVHVGKTWLRIGKGRILKGDVGEVSILPECQGNGYGTALMTDSVEWMKKEKFDVSRLGGLVKFYSRFGYLRFPRRHVEFTLGMETSAGASKVREGEIPLGAELESKIRPFNPQTDRHSYVKLFEEFNQLYNGSAILLPEDKKALSQKDNIEPLSFVFKEGKKVLGYLFAREELTESEASIVMTIGYLRDKPYILTSLIKYINNLALKKGTKRITARIPFDPEILEILSGMPIRFDVIETYGGKVSNMLQIINLQSLLERLIPELEYRARNFRASNWKGVLSIEMEKDAVELGLENGKIRVVENKRADIRLFIREIYLLKLILGLLSFEEVRNGLDRRIKLNPLEATLLNALFPRKLVSPAYWM